MAGDDDDFGALYGDTVSEAAPADPTTGGAAPAPAAEDDDEDAIFMQLYGGAAPADEPKRAIAAEIVEPAVQSGAKCAVAAWLITSPRFFFFFFLPC